jgi:DNA (cytosine-5)-methyltransferase 1
MIKYISLFAGIGGFDLGIQQVDPTVKRVFSSEIDKYARQIYTKNFGVEPHGDITKIKASDIPDHDILCGGFPCQTFSIAGKRRGFEDTRGTLFFEIMRIAKVKRPKLLYLENVRGLLSHEGGRTFQTILGSMDDMGYDAEWQEVFNSKNHGVPQNRERVFIIGHLRGAGTRPIFPITNSIGEISKTGDGDDISTGCITTRNQSGQAQWDGSTTLISNAIDANYYKGIDNHGQRTAILCDSGQGRKDQLRTKTIAPLRANTGAGHNNVVVDTPCIVQRTHGFNKGGAIELPCLRSSSFEHNDFLFDNQQRMRRLTPTECERLQGFPDNWTKQGTTLINNVHILGNVCQKINVQLMDVKGKLSTGNQSYALCITKDGRNGAIRTSHTPPTKKMLDNVVLKGVLEIAIAENCVCDITNHGNDMVMLSIQTNTLKIEEITKKNLILERMEERYTKPLLRIKLEENLTKERLFTTLTWIKEIIKSRIFTCVKTGQPIMDVIIHWNSPQHNSLKPNILFSRMENIESISDTQRYKCLGNAVTVNVIVFIFQHIEAMLSNKDAVIN